MKPEDLEAATRARNDLRKKLEWIRRIDDGAGRIQIRLLSGGNDTRLDHEIDDEALFAIAAITRDALWLHSRAVAFLYPESAEEIDNEDEREAA